MNFAHEPIFQWLAQYAYEPQLVYSFVFIMMLASGFGFPVPEEVTIVSVGILAYMGAHPDLFPAPVAGAPVVNGYEAAVVTFFAVAFTDCVVFWIGRIFGRKLFRMPRLQKIFSQGVMDKINAGIKKYGILAAFFFRFTPGVRFPAHLILGMSQFQFYQFALIDGVAAAISVPTQILLIYNYGEPILTAMHRFKFAIFVIITIATLVILVRLWLNSRRLQKMEKSQIR